MHFVGYIGSESFLNQIYDLLCELKQINPNIMYSKCVATLYYNNYY